MPAHTHPIPGATSYRTLAGLFLPLVALVVAAIIANVGGGLAQEAKAANTVTISATILSNRAITNTCGSGGTIGTLSLGATLAANSLASGTCTVTFGSTNSSSTLNIAASATNLGFSGFAAMTSTCAAPTAGKIGIATTSAGSATETAGNLCSTAGQVKIAPTTPTSFCTAAAGANVTCAIFVALHTGTVAPGAKTGVLTQSLT
jgi:hypothetical protein